MAFLQPALLFALPAVFIPLIIHLLHRRRFQEKSWGAMRFLHEALQEKRGRRKVRHWLVLAVRMLAVAMLVLAMSRPLIGGWLAGWGGSGDRSVVLVMDRSASMERLLPSGLSKRALALQTISETLAQVKPSEVWLLNEPVSDHSKLTDQLGPTDGSADIPALLMQAFQHWKATQQRSGELWIASDLQATSWRADDSATWADVQAAYAQLEPAPTLRLLTFPGGETNRSIRCETKQRKLLVTIQQESNETITLPLTIKQGDQTTRKEVTLSGAVTTLTLDMPSDGVIIGHVSLPEDGNPQDNTAHFVFAPEARPSVAVVCENPQIEALLTLAMTAMGDIEVTREATWQDEALIVWQGESPVSNEIEAYLAEGGRLLTFPSEQAIVETSETGLPITRRTRDEGPLRDTGSGESLPLGNLRTFKYTALSGNALASLAPNPWLTMDGNIYVCATLPLTSWSNLGEGPVLLPLLQRLLSEGQERFAQVDTREVDQAPWQAGIWPRADGGWEVTVRPLDEDALQEATIDSLGDLPFQEFTMEGEASPTGTDVLNEWWRPMLFLGLLLILVEGLLTRMPVKRSSATAT